MAEKSVVRTDRAPAPFSGAPYSQGIRVGELVFVAGQVGMRPGGSEVVGATIEEQTEQVCENLKAILEEAGTGFDRVVKTTCFLADMGDFPAFNEVYARSFGARPPARSTIQVARLPLGVLVEVECVALLD